MKRFGILTFLLFTVFLQNCDNHISISNNQGPRYVAKIHLTAITSADILPPQVKNLLVNESLMDKNPIKFPLAYYLIQSEDIKVLYSKNFDAKIISQLYLEISGNKYYKLFVHPDLEPSYSFLKHAYRYIGPEDTEFYGSPTSIQKTMIVWNKKHNLKIPFIVKTEIDGNVEEKDDTRAPANDEYKGPAGTAQMFFHRTIRGRKEPIEGQQVSEVPEYPAKSQ
jgi:hypothetical protein